MIILKKYFYIVILLFIALFNSYIKIGIIEDGNHHLLDALLADNFIVGHEGFSTFPFNSRMFPTYLPHISIGLAKILKIYDIDLLSSIFTFVVYAVPIAILLIILFNIPKNKRENFEIIFLSFMTCFLFMEYHIWTENINTALFLWIIFVIYYYIDFNKLSKFNIFSILLFSFISISSHPMVVVFILPFLLFGIKKLFNTKNIDNKNKIVIIISFLFLFCAFIFNIYYLFYPIALPDDYFKFKVFCNSQFIIFTISMFSILVLSFFHNRLSQILLVLFCSIIFYSLILKIDSCVGYPYRTLGFYIPIFFMLFIVFKDRCKFVLNYKYLKFLNYVLIIVVLCNSINIGFIWNRCFKNVQQYSQENKYIDFYDYSNMLPNIHHKAGLPIIFTIITNKNDCNLIINSKKYNNKEYVMLPNSIRILKDNTNKLKIFNISSKKINDII